jgi:very-short-patch-repair endonuclease
VKFLRFAQWKIEQAGRGVVGMITNHSYLDNPTFRGMRRSLMQTFDEIYILDLHGNSLKRERCPDGSPDENVFDIRQGVAIAFFVKTGKGGAATVHHADLRGRREAKYEWLDAHDIRTTPWTEVHPKPEFYLFVPRDEAEQERYNTFPKVTDIFPTNSVGIVTARDGLTIHWTPDEVWRTVLNFSRMDPELARQTYQLGKDVSHWKVPLAQQDLRDSGPSREKIVPILYRPFDVRYTYYTGRTRGFHSRPLFEVMRHMLAGENVAIIVPRRVEHKGEWQHAFVSQTISDHVAVSLKTIDYHFPLYLYPDTERGDLFGSSEPQERRPNLNPKLVAALQAVYYPTPVPPAHEWGMSDPTPIPPPHKWGGAQGEGFDYPHAWGGDEGEGLDSPHEQGMSDPTPVPPPHEWGMSDPTPIPPPHKWGGDTGEGLWYTPPHLWEKLKPLARQMRKNPTPAENKLWQHLRGKQLLGYKFRRQHAIERFIVDFYCHDARLVVEVDGPIHQYTTEEDAIRQKFLESLGFRVLRFTNEQVLTNIDGVLNKIAEALRQTNAAPTLTPEQIFHYVYAVLYAPSYRERYADFLRLDFPRIPFPSDREVFEAMAKLGERLVALHLLRSPELDPPLARFEGQGDSRIEKSGRSGLRYDAHQQRIYINASQYIAPVPQQVWEYQIGGYQVLAKWLKDRVGRCLSLDEIRTYCRIVTAIARTIELQSEIDRIYSSVEDTALELRF